MNKSPLNASLNSSNMPKIFRVASAGNYFRQNPTYIRDERMVELLNTKNNQCSLVSLNESYINSSSDVIVNGPRMAILTIDERENHNINRKYSTYMLCRRPESSVSGCYSKPCSFLSNSGEAKDKFMSLQKGNKLSVFNEKYQE
ncbi:hypothetical protein RF11_05696 [Thelohanellus kitauei]|uniref:Uncharacterized protein n=1 Tax=Thelohanellus kitauei TaxID=669202 RepID=A0A0C2MJC0_THEKT|nr:hypothetical protein RF11_05696 [Thelohanellus kitauei]